MSRRRIRINTPDGKLEPKSCLTILLEPRVSNSIEAFLNEGEVQS